MNEPGVRTIDTIAAEINGIKEQVRATVVSGGLQWAADGTSLLAMTLKSPGME